MTTALWALATAVWALVAVATLVARAYLTESRLDVLSDDEVADNQAPFGQGVMGVPARPPVNGSGYEDLVS
jgi:hypothetical protein